MRIAGCGLIALLLAAGGAAARDVTECDRLATNPFDPERVVETGPLYDDLVHIADAAIAACRTAVKADPENLRLLYLLGRSLDAGGQYDEAIALYRRTADAGYGMAMNALGRAYVLGTGVVVDTMASVAWYEQAAEAGVYAAAANLGDMYNDGKGEPDDDPAEALRWYLLAAESNYTYAVEKAGFFYATGLGTELDYDKALGWFLKAYDLGSGNAAKNLAVMYENGYAVDLDFARAGQLYFEAIERGDPTALDTYAAYALESHAEIWRAAERLLNERGRAEVEVDGVPDRETLLALIGMVPAADEAALLKAFDEATGTRGRPAP